jgi:ergothioneine biosynthesis protein EgtB
MGYTYNIKQVTKLNKSYSFFCYSFIFSTRNGNKNMADLEKNSIQQIRKMENLKNKFEQVRQFTEWLTIPLHTEDYVIQTMEDVSPTKWHLAHTTWFFENFILKRQSNYKSQFSQYDYLFNSYYIQAGKRFLRPKRGHLSRPTVKEVYDYRKYINKEIISCIEELDEETLSLIEVGINHEQQHQELILTDIKHVLSVNPLKPYYKQSLIKAPQNSTEMEWIEVEEGIYEIGYNGEGFHFDNEKPHHKRFLHAYAIANRLITNGEYLEFIDADGYNRPELWLSDGAYKLEEEKWDAPLYWEKIDNEWYYFTLTGFKKVNLLEPVCHISYYEADAFARWKGYRLPSEDEWETASYIAYTAGNFVENQYFNPIPDTADSKNKLHQMFGDVWEWTQSAYSPYPNYKAAEGAIGEYNGKFMCNQMSLRGGSCVTPQSHIRRSYRNFFPPHARWQFTGIRLAKGLV